MTLQGVKRKVVTVSDFRFTGRILGKGNFARVEEAVHNILDIKVAVKIIDLKEIKEKYVMKNLHREARIMAILNHPCIAALFQTMQSADNVYYLVTELVPGGDLCSFITAQRYGKLEERPARVFARQFASALCHMHSFGIVHRDLKMENVILNSAQTQIKIVDFGLSNVWTKQSPLHTNCGSPEYAAPELFVAGKDYGPEVDLWSLGIIFYGMVVGQLPFVGGRKNQFSSQERRKRLVEQINKGLGTVQRHALASLSAEFRAMLNKLLAADPTKRITGKELLVHPWLTEKGKKYIQTYPLQNLSNELQTKFNQQIGDVFKMGQNKVLAEIEKNPYGRLGGMYNILKFRQIVGQFNPDHLTLNLLCNKTKIASASLVKSQHTLYNQWVTLLDKVSKEQIEKERAKTALPARVGRFAQPKEAQIIRSDTKKNQKKINADEVKTRRPQTTGPIRICRPPKRNRSVSAALSPRIKQNGRELQRNQVSAQMGDGLHPKKLATNVTSQNPRAKDRLVNDPIARSIAGYLLRNVPNRMLSAQNKKK